MRSSTVDRTGATPSGRDSAQRSPTAWLRWLGTGGRIAPQSAQAAHVEQLELEMALLQEENARLKVQRQRTRNRSVHERVRELLPADDEDEPRELLTDCLLLRDDLLDACREIERGVRETRRRLEGTKPRQAPAPRRNAATAAAKRKAPGGLKRAA